MSVNFMFGLTYKEEQDGEMTPNYAKNYDRRQAQIQNRMPSSVSDRYKRSIMLRYQRIRDMHNVCSVHCSYDNDFHSSGDPEFIQECKRKQKKYHAEMTMLVIAFPFLRHVSSLQENDV